MYLCKVFFSSLLLNYLNLSCRNKKVTFKTSFVTYNVCFIYPLFCFVGMKMEVGNDFLINDT